MYNPQLDTFIRAADAGSFSKAAEEAYITPTAVIKQINALEAALGIRLFVRTHRGLTLTESGKSLYNDAKHIIQYSKDSVARARKAAERAENVIRIGASPMTPGEFLFALWPKIHAFCPDLKFQLSPFENTPENARKILQNLGRDIDVVAGYFDDSYPQTRGCASLKLKDAPIRCALSIHHRLAAKNSLTVQDLSEESLMLIHRGWNTYVDVLRNFIERQPIDIVDFDFFNVSVFNQCENGNDLLMAFDEWRNVHPLLRILPVEWEYTVPFGLLHSPAPSATVQVFLDAVRTVSEL
jgi:DNA-binding transcriptional LysR family regulator